MFGGASREGLRRAYAEAWAKHLARAPLTPLEAAIIDVIAAHPEYQDLAANPESAVAFEASRGNDAENPFLHMGLHLAVREQLQIDRPPGICGLYGEMQSLAGGSHEAQHAMMESLGEILWAAQRSGRAPDEQAYLELIRARVAGRPR